MRMQSTYMVREEIRSGGVSSFVGAFMITMAEISLYSPFPPLPLALSHVALHFSRSSPLFPLFLSLRDHRFSRSKAEVKSTRSPRVKRPVCYIQPKENQARRRDARHEFADRQLVRSPTCTLTTTRRNGNKQAVTFVAL